MRVLALPPGRIAAATAAGILSTLASFCLMLQLEAGIEVIVGELLEPGRASPHRPKYPPASADQLIHLPLKDSRLGIGVAANSCTNGNLDSTTDGDAERSDINGRDVPVSDPENGAQNGTGNGDAAVERRRALDGQRLELVALEPGKDVGPYRLQEHLGYLGSRPVHALDPAFHPHEVKRVAYEARGMLSAPPLPMCPTTSEGPPWHSDHGGVGLVLQGDGTKESAGHGEGTYRLKRRFEGGSHGEVWRAVRIGPDGNPVSGEGYVLKRMLLEKGQLVMQAGIREIYFGELLRGRLGSQRVARYVEHLYLFGDHERGRFGRAGDGGEGGGISGGGMGGEWDEGAVPTEMWLVFHDEGVSLRHYLYTEREAEGFVLHGQSAFWRDMRLDPEGPEVMKSILRQTLEGTRFLHSIGILHRDLKPSNLIVSLPPTIPTAETPGANESRRGGAGATDVHQASPGSTARPVASWVGRGSGHPNPDLSSTPNHGTRKRRRGGWGGTGRGAGGGGDDRDASPVLLKVADFSSAVDEGSMAAGLYGTVGPGQGEETLQYAPPEVLFNPETAYSAKRPESYDVWSIGVILLELVLGTPEVFTVDQRTRAILDRDLAFEDDSVRRKAHLLAAMADMCIYSRSGYLDSHSSSSPQATAAGTPSFDDCRGRKRRGGDGVGSGGRGGGGRAGGGQKGRGDYHDTSQRVHWPLGDRAVVDERCTLAELGKAIHTRDALDIGFLDQWGLDLLWRLLRWDPMDRISVADALEHAYFVGPYMSRRDGSAHATRREAMAYDGWFIGSKRGGAFALTNTLPPTPHTTLWGNTSPGACGAGGFHRQGGLWETGDAGKLVPAPSRGGAGLNGNEFILDNQHSLIDLQYSCPKCNRTFELWKSCHNHVAGRDHASFCNYDTSALPPCVSSHSMLPFDPHSGWCDVQGRRSRIEDYHSIVFQEDYKFYGVFDGHCGTRAAKFASRALHVNLELFLNAAQASPQYPPPSTTATTTPPGTDGLRPRSRRDNRGNVYDDLSESAGANKAGFGDRGRQNTMHKSRREAAAADARERNNEENACQDVENRAGIERAVRAAFRKTQEDFLELTRGQESSSAAATEGVEGRGYPKDGEGGGGGRCGGGAGGADEDSGTTATVALVYPHFTVVAHVGDSRAVMCCDELGNAVDVTEDHTPYSDRERARVEANGGSVEFRGVLRVNGELAVTRTIGNRRLSRDGVLSSEPDVVFISHCSGNKSGEEGRKPAGGGGYGRRSRSNGDRARYDGFARDNGRGREGGGDAPGDGTAAFSDRMFDARDCFLSSNLDERDIVGNHAPAGHTGNNVGSRRDDSSKDGGGGDGDVGGASSADTNANSPAFLVLASDGLWDVLSSQEAVTMVQEVVLGATGHYFGSAHASAERHDKAAAIATVNTGAVAAGQRGGTGRGRERSPRDYGLYDAEQAFQMAATALTHEAYVRGSTDNIGVCVVDLRPH